MNNITNEIYEACARQYEREPRRTYLGMSQIGKPCMRELWLDFNGYPRHRLDGQTARILEFGRAREEAIIMDLSLAGYEVFNRQLEFWKFDGKFGGHCDGLIEGPGLPDVHVLEIKTANDKNFKAIKKDGIKVAKPVYYVQAQCYLGFANILYALFVVENKNNQELYMERVPFEDEAFKKTMENAKAIVESTRPFSKIEDRKDCKWCDFFGHVCDTCEEQLNDKENNNGNN